MRRRLAFLVAALLVAGPAEAHKLKVFAAVEGNAVSGFAFFVGGGRPEGSAWTAKDAAGKQIATGSTDSEGRFAFSLPATIASAVTITVDTHEAHIASATIAADRLGPVAAASSVAAQQQPGPAAAPATPDAAVAALVNAAVQKQVEPLLERIEQMDSRLRFVDMLSGVFLIIGLVGIALWARARRR